MHVLGNGHRVDSGKIHRPRNDQSIRREALASCMLRDEVELVIQEKTTAAGMEVITMGREEDVADLRAPDRLDGALEQLPFGALYVCVDDVHKFEIQPSD